MNFKLIKNHSRQKKLCTKHNLSYIRFTQLCKKCLVEKTLAKKEDGFVYIRRDKHEEIKKRDKCNCFNCFNRCIKNSKYCSKCEARLLLIKESAELMYSKLKSGFNLLNEYNMKEDVAFLFDLKPIMTYQIHTGAE